MSWTRELKDAAQRAGRPVIKNLGDVGPTMRGKTDDLAKKARESASGTRRIDNTKPNLKKSKPDKPKQNGDGEVVFRPPKKGATQAELKQLQAYVDSCNRALRDGHIQGRVSTSGTTRSQANAAARAERARAVREGTPYHGVVGHGPDTTWTDMPIPPEWIDMSARVNSSLGRQAQDYPIGFQPTGFRLELPPGFTVSKG